MLQHFFSFPISAIFLYFHIFTLFFGHFFIFFQIVCDVSTDSHCYFNFCFFVKGIHKTITLRILIFSLTLTSQPIPKKSGSFFILPTHTQMISVTPLTCYTELQIMPPHSAHTTLPATTPPKNWGSFFVPPTHTQMISVTPPNLLHRAPNLATTFCPYNTSCNNSPKKLGLFFLYLQHTLKRFLSQPPPNLLHRAPNYATTFCPYNTSCNNSPKKSGLFFCTSNTHSKDFCHTPLTSYIELQIWPPHFAHTTLSATSPRKKNWVPFFCTSNTQSAVILDPPFFSNPTLFPTVYLWPLFAL